jgi:drug/metabolite transporter (DMT)-like permease
MTITSAAAKDGRTTAEVRTLVRRRGTLLILAASFCFGTSGVLAKPAMDAGLSPQQVASVRIALAALVLLVAVGVFRPSLLKVRRSDLRLLAGYGLVGVAGVQVLYFAAVARIPIGIAMLLEFTAPILVALWVRFVRRVILPARMWGGTVLALVGLALVGQVWEGLRLDAVGLLAAIGAALCAAAYFLIGEHGMSTLTPIGMVTWGMVVGAIAVAFLAPPWSLPADRLASAADLGSWRVPVWTLLAACAVVSTAIAYLLSISALRYLPANVASVLALCEPVVATTLAWLLLDQTLTAVQVAGAAILLTGATIVQLTEAKVDRKKDIDWKKDTVHPHG